MQTKCYLCFGIIAVKIGLFYLQDYYGSKCNLYLVIELNVEKSFEFATITYQILIGLMEESMKIIALIIMLLCFFSNSVSASDFYQECIMIEAIDRGDISKVQELLDGGFEPNQKVVIEQTGLMLAAGKGQTAIAKLFLDHGSDVNKKIYNRYQQRYNSPLMAATKHADIMKLFIAAGANLNDQTGTETVLSKALAEGSQDVAVLLLKSGVPISNLYEAAMLGDKNYISQNANASNINWSFGKNGTPLIASIIKNDLTMTELILKLGANPDMASNSGEIPLLEAVKAKNLGMIKLLSLYGANPNSRRLTGAIEYRSSYVTIETPLILAAKDPELFKILKGFGAKPMDINEAAILGNVETVKEFINNGADVNSGQPITPLIAAADGGNAEVIQLLLANGADITRTTTRGITPLMVAAEKGNLEAINTLIAAGANVNAVSNTFKFSALIIAAAKGHLEVITSLVNAGADLTLQSSGLETLAVAAGEGNLDSVKLLVSLGAKPTHQTMYRALLNKRYDIMEYLLSTGMDINEKDRNGATYLESAVVMGDEKMVRLLLAHGADVNSRDANGVTVLGHAGLSAKYFLFDLLQSNGGII